MPMWHTKASLMHQVVPRGAIPLALFDALDPPY